MNHHLRRKSFKTCASSFETCESFKTCESFDDVMNHHLRRDESRLYVVYYVCLLYLFRHRSIYSFLIEVYLHPPLKYIFFRHRSITPIAEAVHYHVLKLLIHPLNKISVFGESALSRRRESEIKQASRVIFWRLWKPLVIHYPSR